MLRASWLIAFRQSLATLKQRRRICGARLRRQPHVNTHVLVDILEDRRVMSGTPLTAAQLATTLASAQLDKTNADTAAQNAKTNFDTQTSGAINSLQSALAGLATSAQGALDGQKAIVDGLIDGAKTSLDTAVNGLNSALQGTLDGFKSSLDGAVAISDATHQSQVNAAHNQYQTDFNTIKLGHDSTVDGLVGGFQANVDAARGIFDGTVSGAQSLFEGAIGGAGGFDDQLDGVIAAQTTSYNTNEGNDWNNNYLNAIGTGATGLQTIYNNSISTADSVLAGVLAVNPSVNYDPSSILDSSTYQAYVAGQLAWLQSQLQSDSVAYNTNVTNRLNQLDNQIYGPSGFLTTYQNQVHGIEDGFRHDADTLAGQLSSDLQGDEDAYNQSTTGVGGLEDQLDTALDGEATLFEVAIDAAEGNYDSTLSAPKNALQSTVDAEVDGFEDWLTGGSGTLNESTTITANGTTPETYTTTYTSTDANGNSTTWTTTSTAQPPDLPSGATSVTLTGTTTGNPYKRAMDQRLDSLRDELQGLLDTFNDSASTARDQLQASVLAANQLFWDQVYKPNATPPSAFDAYQSVVNSQQASLGGNLQGDFNQYQTDAQSVWDAYSAAMATWMYGDMTDPPPTLNTSALDGHAKTYWIAADTDGANANDAIGGAFAAFVGAAVAKDTTRVQSIDNALAQYATDLENAESTLVLGVEGAMTNFANDAVDISHALAEEAVQRFLTAEGNIDVALDVYQLAQNAALDQFKKDGDTALRDYEKNSANDIDGFRHQEAAKWKQFELDAANDENAYENAIILKVQALVTAEAAAEDAFEQNLDSVENQAEKDLNGFAAAGTQSTTADFLLFATNVANELATEYAAAFGNPADVVAVANAYAQNLISKIAAWKASADGEATAFKNYSDQEADDRKAANDALASANDLHSTQIVGQWVTFASAMANAMLAEVTTLAPQEETMSNSIADEDRNADQALADKEKIENDAVADADKQRADDRANNELTYTSQVIGAMGSNFTVVDLLQRTFDHYGVNQQSGLAGFAESQAHSLNLSSIGLQKTTALSFATLDDPLINANVGKFVANQKLTAWNQVAYDSAAPDSDYSNRYPTGPSSNMMLNYPFYGPPVRPQAPATGSGGGSTSSSTNSLQSVLGQIDATTRVKTTIQVELNDGTSRPLFDDPTAAIRTLSPIPKSAARITNPVVNPNPTVLGLLPSNPNAVLQPAEHALGQHLGTGNGSPFISASMRPRGATGISGTQIFWINIDRAVAEGAEFISEEALNANMAELAKQDPTLAARAKMWQAAQVGEREVLFQGTIDPRAVDTIAMRSLRHVGRGVMIYGVARTTIDLGVAVNESVQERSVAPVAAETVRQVGGWGGAWLGFKAGAAIGTAAGIETGPGAVLTGITGGLVGGVAGYVGADWIADWIYAN